MQDHVAQAVALVAHANLRLRGAGSGPFFPSHPTCRFCEWVRFVDATRVQDGRVIESPLAPAPDAWFDRLAAEGVRRVRLAYEPSRGGIGRDPDTVAFAGRGGLWWILVEPTGRPPEGWLGRWTLGDQASADRRIWRVTYGRFGDVKVPAPANGLASSAQALEHGLEEISAFAKQHADGAFRREFDQALAILRAKAPLDERHALAPAGTFPAPALRLLAACQAAWVFGGMGSWNDRSFEGETGKAFDRVTERHWDAVAAALVSATNATAPSVPVS